MMSAWGQGGGGRGTNQGEGKGRGRGNKGERQMDGQAVVLRQITTKYFRSIFYQFFFNF